MIVNIKKILILIAILFLGVMSSYADGSYKNELTKVKLSPIGSDDVKITLYMAKPYSEPLRLLKKNDGEFVLILPETYSSAPQKPSISDVIGEITDADVKLYSFVSNSSQNGYTKIVIKTNGLVNLYPEAVTSGGGTLVLNAQQEQYKVTASQPKVTQQPKVQTPPQTQQPAPTVNKKSSNEKPVTVSAQQSDKNVVKPQKEVSNNDKKDNQTIKKVVETPIQDKDTLPIIELPKISEKPDTQNLVVPLEEVKVDNIDANVTSKTENKAKKSNKLALFFGSIKNKAVLFVKDKGLFEQGNLLVIFASLFILGIVIKISSAILKSANPQEDLILDNEKADNKEKFKTYFTLENQSDDDEKPEYSTFFKTLIEAEVKGNNPFNMAKTDEAVPFESDNEPRKTHQEVLNEDQNLTWQEKFRALQKNKKALLKDDETFDYKDNSNMEISSDMHIENPIKKLTQDFKAVRKVLEKQKAKQQETSVETNIEQNFTPEKTEKIEVISFEDFQKNVSKPKIQVNTNTTSPMKVSAPKVLTQLQLGNKKGLYLVDYKDKISLMGYVDDKVFRLKTYDNLRDTKLYARLSQKNDNTETYIVKFDNNKMLIDVNDEQMKLKLMY